VLDGGGVGGVARRAFGSSARGVGGGARGVGALGVGALLRRARRARRVVALGRKARLVVAGARSLVRAFGIF